MDDLPTHHSEYLKSKADGVKKVSRVMTAYGVDRERRLLGRTIGWTVPDLRNDFTKGGGDLVGKVLKDGQVRMKVPVTTGSQITALI